MSHRASHWLAELPPEGITNGAFRVLFHLCDAHNSKRPPETACFPSQEALRAATGLSNGGLNKALNDIEAAGLMRRRRTRNQDGTRGSTYYILGCDVDLAQHPTPQNGDGANSTFGGQPTPLSGMNQLHSSGVEPVSEPVREPVIPQTPIKSDLFEVGKPTSTKRPSEKNDEEAMSILSQVCSPPVAREFVAHRREMKKPITPRSARAMAGKVKSHPNPDAVFNESIANGWQGIFPEKIKSGGQGNVGNRAKNWFAAAMSAE